MGLREKLKPNEKQPQQSAVAVVQPVAIASTTVVVPPPAVCTITDCPHRLTRVVTIVPPEAFDFDETTEGKPHLIIDRTNEDWWERFEECLWCGEWFDLVDESTEETKPSAVFEW